MFPQAKTPTNSRINQPVPINLPNKKRGKEPNLDGYKERKDILDRKVTQAEDKVKEEENQLSGKGKNVEELKKKLKELEKKLLEAVEEQIPAAAIAAHKRARQTSAKKEEQKAQKELKELKQELQALTQAEKKAFKARACVNQHEDRKRKKDELEFLKNLVSNCPQCSAQYKLYQLSKTPKPQRPTYSPTLYKPKV